jgi:hypothetical protein
MFALQLGTGVRIPDPDLGMSFSYDPVEMKAWTPIHIAAISCDLVLI